MVQGVSQLIVLGITVANGWKNCGVEIFVLFYINIVMFVNLGVLSWS